jgi:hypothetical protein
MARPSNQKAKEKKQKMILAGLGAVLLIVLAIELPGMLSSGSAPSAASATTTTTAAGAPATPAALASAPATVSSSELVFSTSADKVTSLSRFKLKDPFDSHGVGVDAAGAAPAPTDSGAAAADPAAAVAAAATAAAKQAAAAAGTGSAGPLFGTIQGTAPRVGKVTGRSLPSAKIRFNGVTMTVALGQTFPKAHPIFRLAGVKPDGVIISVLKGSLADGSGSLDLLKHTPLTLVNTATGGRFQIVLLSASKAT